MKSKRETTTRKVSGMHMPNRRYAVIAFYIGLSCIVISLFISFIYIRPANFKSQFKRHQLADCLKTTTAAVTCHKNFDTK